MELERAIPFLQERINEIDNLFHTTKSSTEFQKWKTKTTGILIRIFDDESPRVKNFTNIAYSFVDDPECYGKGLNIAKGMLQGIIEEINDLGIPDKNTKENTVNITQTQSVNINIDNTLKNNLTNTQYEELKNILKENNKEKKGKQLTDFLKKVGETTAIEILKSILNLV